MIPRHVRLALVMLAISGTKFVVIKAALLIGGLALNLLWPRLAGQCRAAPKRPALPSGDANDVS